MARLTDPEQEARAIGLLYNRCRRLMRLRAWDRRRIKRVARLAHQAFDRWFRLKGIDPHSLAVPDPMSADELAHIMKDLETP